MFNYYGFDHPDPRMNAVLTLALQVFSAGIDTRIQQIQADIQSAGKTAQVGFVDTFSAMTGRSGLLLIEKRNGFNGVLDFEIHLTNAGHAVIAHEFVKA